MKFNHLIDRLQRSFVLPLAVAAGLMWGFIGGMLLRDYLPVDFPYLGGSKTELPILNEAHAILTKNALNPPPEDSNLEYGMIRGMLEAYGDPYTIFLEPVQTELESHSLQGSYGGIGARMGSDRDGYIVLFPFPDSPAVRAGVLEGDRLLKVDGMDVPPDIPITTVLALVRGPVGKTVRLTVAQPPDYSPRQISVKRQEIPLPSVTWHLDPVEPRLGVVEINMISANTPKEIQQAVDDMSPRGATHYVLDLRNNGGGLLVSGVDTARLFLKEGDILQHQYKDKDVETYRAERPGALADIPLAVLVNQNTASAAEVIAGALQMQRRAVLVGQPTYGKNTIQLIFTLSDRSSLHVTAARWWIPGLDFPQEEYGLYPDIFIPLESEDTRAAFDATIAALFGDR